MSSSQPDDDGDGSNETETVKSASVTIPVGISGFEQDTVNYDDGNLSIDVSGIKNAMTHERKNWVIAFLGITAVSNVIVAILLVAFSYSAITLYQNSQL